MPLPNRINKAAYRSHTYSGPRGSRKRIQAALRLHYGESSRAAIWRKRQKKQTQNIEQEEANKVAIQNRLSAHKDQNVPQIKTYSRAITKLQNEVPSCTTNIEPSEPVEVVWFESVNSPESESDTDVYELPEEIVSSDNLSLMSGYRIVDLKHVLMWAFNMQKHSQSCEGSQIEFVSETQNGFHSTLTFKCSICDKNWHQSTEKDDEINTSFVWATMTAGSHYTQAAHITTLMDIPTMAGNKFREIKKKIANTWHTHLTEEITKAGEQERCIAIEKGNISSDGTPYVTVFVDGGWSKSTYGHNLDPLAGMACIIGKETKKCLFFGAKNKYCYTCQYYKQMRMEVKDHHCCKNLTGPFSTIESDIIVEGFQKSEEIHDLRYQSFIGDGDSSVFSHLKEKVSYGNQIKKFECKNYIIKNYTSTLYKILANTKLPLYGRNILKSRLVKLIRIARKMIVHNSGNPSSMVDDLRNGPHHVFGNHEKCKEYYCSLVNSPSDNKSKKKNLVTILKSTAPRVWALIYAANERVFLKAANLSNETTNIATNFMNVINKFNGDKRLSHRKGGSYQRSVHIAGLAQAAGYKWHETGSKKRTDQRGRKHFKQYIQRKERSRLYRQKLKSQNTVIQKPKTLPDRDEGTQASNAVDIDVVEFRKKCDERLKEFQECPENIRNIESKTIGKNENDIMYVKYRSDRLSASHFGKVCKRRNIRPCYTHVKDILYKTNSCMRDLVYCEQNKIVAKATFAKQYNKTVRRSGLFIDEQFGFLAASCDGVIEDEKAVIEIQCFTSLVRKSLNIETAASQIKNFAVQYDGQKLTLNKRHDYYYQVQGQLRITKMVKCYFVCFVSLQQPVTVVEVLRDDEFISNMMPKLVAFYKNFILPEIILRRIRQNAKCVDFTDVIDITSSMSN
ncbi:uncharacterized protein LOC115439875 [Manduca sexta]|nr:uncharacterized protein LOC115439875 [Manduca sexta]